MWNPLPHSHCTTLLAFDAALDLVRMKPDTLMKAHTQLKEKTICAVAEVKQTKKYPGRTFRALPCIPQVLHTDELVIPVEAVMLSLGVVVV